MDQKKLKLKYVKYCALNLTHNCNLRCTYCYTGPKINKTMQRTTAFKAIDFLAGGGASSPCTVTFFGGEPLIEFTLLKEIVLYSVKTYGQKIIFRLSTNGTSLSPDIIQFSKQYDIVFALSIDGHKEQHDHCRCLASGIGSYNDIEKNIPLIFSFNPYTIAVSVVVPETAHMLARGVMHLFNMGFRYVLQTIDYSGSWNSQHIKVLKGRYNILADYYAEAISRDKKIYYSPFDERIKTWAQKPYGNGDLCDLANTQIAIAPSGRIYPCVQFIGSDEDSYL